MVSLAKCLRERAEPTRVKYLSLALPSGRLLALPTNITLGWKGLTGKNTLAYLSLWVNGYEDNSL
jgi:hypothetical protein